jgi:hypothetical protein
VSQSTDALASLYAALQPEQKDAFVQALLDHVERLERLADLQHQTIQQLLSPRTVVAASSTTASNPRVESKITVDGVEWRYCTHCYSYQPAGHLCVSCGAPREEEK